MSEHNITVEGGSSVRLPTAGKYCDRDIVITAKGSSGGGQVYVDEIVEVKVGDTISFSSLGEDCVMGTPIIDAYDCGENPNVIRVDEWEVLEGFDVSGVEVGRTILTYEYWTDREEGQENFQRVRHIQINVVSGGSIESDAEYQYTDTINMSVGDTEMVFMPCPYDSPGVGDYTVIQNGHLVSVYAWGGDSVDISANETGTAILRFDYSSYEPVDELYASCTYILTINIF